MSMNERYEPQPSSRRWQSRWDAGGRLPRRAAAPAPRRYVLEMLPYPSGAMHMGHVRNYLIGDVLRALLPDARLRRAAPHGLGRLRAARGERRHQGRRATRPCARGRTSTRSGRRCSSLGYAYDWTREVDTADPEYYRWNQWFFIKMLEKGMVYRRVRQGELVHRLPHRHRQRAGEGRRRCERCDSPVRREGDARVGVPHHRATRRRCSTGWTRSTSGPSASPRCSATGSAERGRRGRLRGRRARRERIKVFTTRIDTIFGCTYVVLAPDHPLVARGHRARSAGRGARRSSSGCARPTPRADRRGRAEGGRLHRRPRGEPVHRRAGAGLDRQLRARRLRHRRGDERARARPARLRVRAQVRAARSRS